MRITNTFITFANVNKKQITIKIWRQQQFGKIIMYAPSIIYKSVIAESEGYNAQWNEVYKVAVNLAKSKGLKDFQIHLYKGYGSNWIIDID